MASRWDELLDEYDTLGTQDGQAQFITDRTGFSEECIRPVLVHLMTQSVIEAWDLEAQARTAGVSVEDYALAMSPLLEMNVEQATACLREIETRMANGEDPVLSDDELEQVQEWEPIVGPIASLSGEADEVVITILFAVSALNNRQHEIVQELTLLESSGEGPRDSVAGSP